MSKEIPKLPAKVDKTAGRPQTGESGFPQTSGEPLSLVEQAGAGDWVKKIEAMDEEAGKNYQSEWMNKVSRIAQEYRRITGDDFKGYVMRKMEPRAGVTKEDRDREMAEEEFRRFLDREKQEEVVKRIVDEEKSRLVEGREIPWQVPIVSQEEWSDRNTVSKSHDRGGSGVEIKAKPIYEMNEEERQSGFEKEAEAQVKSEAEKVQNSGNKPDSKKIMDAIMNTSKYWGVVMLADELLEFIEDVVKDGKLESPNLFRDFRRWKDSRKQKKEESEKPEQVRVEKKLSEPPAESGESETESAGEWNTTYEGLRKLSEKVKAGDKLSPSEEHQRDIWRGKLNEIWEDFKGPGTQVQKHEGWKDRVASEMEIVIGRDKDVAEERAQAANPQYARDRQNPIFSLEERLDATIRELVSYGEDGNPPPNKQESIQLAWYEGVKRNVQAAALTAELALYTELGLDGKPEWVARISEIRKNLSELGLEADYMNFGAGVRERTKDRLGNLSARYVDYLRKDGPRAEELKKEEADREERLRQQREDERRRAQTPRENGGIESTTNPEFLRKKAEESMAVALMRGAWGPGEKKDIEEGIKYLPVSEQNAYRAHMIHLENLGAINTKDSSSMVTTNYDRGEIREALRTPEMVTAQRTLVRLMGLDLANNGTYYTEDRTRVNQHVRIGDTFDNRVFADFVDESGVTIHVDAQAWKDKQFWDVGKEEWDIFKKLGLRQLALDMGNADFEAAAKSGEIRRAWGGAVAFLRDAHLPDYLAPKQEHPMCTQSFWLFRQYEAAYDRLGKQVLPSLYRPYMKFHAGEFPEPDWSGEIPDSPMVKRLFPENWLKPVVLETTIFSQPGTTYFDFLRQDDPGRVGKVPELDEFVKAKEALKFYGFSVGGAKLMFDRLFGPESSKDNIRVDLTFNPEQRWADRLATEMIVPVSQNLGFMTEYTKPVDPNDPRDIARKAKALENIQRVGSVMAHATIGMGLDKDTVAMKDLSAWCVGVVLEGLDYKDGKSGQEIQLISPETAKWIKWHGKPTVEAMEVVVRNWFTQVRLNSGESWQDYYQADMNGRLPEQDRDLITRLRNRATGLVSRQEDLEVKERLNFRRKDGWTGTWYGGPGTFSDKDWHERSTQGFMSFFTKRKENSDLYGVFDRLDLSIYESRQGK